MKLAFVVATKDRPEDIRKMLNSLAGQFSLPDQVVVVDASSAPVRGVLQEFPSLKINYIRHDRPSASAQRNVGIRAVDPGIDLIGFLDDDVILEDGAIEAMVNFWKNAPDDFGGCSFNLRNFEPSGMERLKHSSLARRLGLYSPEKGVVMPSGWQTMIGEVCETTYVQWLPIGASLWRKAILEKYQFEEYFDGYSYLEDLDFSYSVSRQYKLTVVAEAGFYHFHSPSGRISMYDFGKREVANRLFFVKKHRLSVSRCYLALLVRLLMTVWSSLIGLKPEGFKRALGNCNAIAQNLLCGRKTLIRGVSGARR